MARGPTRPLPSNAYADAYAFTIGLSGYWANPEGRDFTWSNATGNFSSDLRQADFTAELNATQLQRQRNAFDLWESYLNCTFTEVADAAGNNIRVGQNNDADTDIGFDVAAYVQHYNVAGRFGLAGIYYDPDQIDDLPYSSRTYIHEVGHVLNLAHPNAHSGGLLSNPVMETSNGQTAIQPGDIIGGQHVFGPASGASSTVPDVVPTLSVAESGDNIVATWTLPIIDGGEAVTSYRVRWYLDGSLVQNTTTSSLTHSRTSAAGEWTARVQAINTEGDGLAKEASGTGTEPTLPVPDIQVEDSTLNVTEGGTVTLRARLTSEPASNVIITATESDSDISITPATRTFTPQNWNVYQSWTVSGIQDTDLVDDTANILLTASGGSTDNALVLVSIADDDAGVNDLGTLSDGSLVTVTTSISDTDPEDIYGFTINSFTINYNRPFKS